MNEPYHHIPLKQKLKDHWNTRDQIFNPEPQIANRMGVMFVWVFGTSLLYSSLGIILPQLYRKGHQIILSQFQCKVLIWFLFIEMMLNWGLCALKTLSKVSKKRLEMAVKNSASGGSGLSSCKIQDAERNNYIGEDDAAILKEHGFNNCPSCQIYVPPRAHHCKVCNMCILKHDHHCYFTASCIGFYNQRYFIVFTFYSLLGSVFGIYLMLEYFDSISALNIDSWYDLAKYLPPVAIFRWLSGWFSGSITLVIVQFWLILIVFCTSCGFFVWQCCLVLQGKTTYEVNKCINRYGMGGVISNIRTTFGPYWLENFILPLRTVPNGDGFNWLTAKQN